MDYAFILLFLYASYLSIEKYVHTGSLLKWRGKEARTVCPVWEKKTEKVLSGAGVIGKSRYRRQEPDQNHETTTAHTEKEMPEDLPHMDTMPERDDVFKRLESEDIPERYEITGYVERPNPHRPRGVTFDDMDFLSRFMSTDNPSKAEQAHVRNTLERLEGTDIGRMLQAGVPGSNERLNRLMNLYVKDDAPDLTERKDRESIIRDFSITDFIP